MNVMSGFALAAFSVAAPEAKPTVTMMSKSWSTNVWMFLRVVRRVLRDDGRRLGGADGGRPCLGALVVYSLKFLSSSVPTSVTTPILRSEWAAPEADAPADADAPAAADPDAAAEAPADADPDAAADGAATEAAADAAVDGAAPDADGDARRCYRQRRTRTDPRTGSVRESGFALFLLRFAVHASTTGCCPRIAGTGALAALRPTVPCILPSRRAVRQARALVARRQHRATLGSPPGSCPGLIRPQASATLRP